MVAHVDDEADVIGGDDKVAQWSPLPLVEAAVHRHSHHHLGLVQVVGALLWISVGCCCNFLLVLHWAGPSPSGQGHWWACI